MNFQTFLAKIGLSTLLVAVLIGIQVGMTTDENNKMSDCLLMDHLSTICDMTGVEHIAKWKSMLSGIVAPHKMALKITLTLIGIIFLFILAKRDKNSRPLKLTKLRESPEAELFDYLKRALARGTMYRKVFA